MKHHHFTSWWTLQIKCFFTVSTKIFCQRSEQIFVVTSTCGHDLKRLTEFGSQLHPLLLVHVVQDGVLGLLPHLRLSPPEHSQTNRFTFMFSNTVGSITVLKWRLETRVHLLQQQMKVQLTDRMNTMSMKLVRMTYSTLHSETSNQLNETVSTETSRDFFTWGKENVIFFDLMLNSKSLLKTNGRNQLCYSNCAQYDQWLELVVTTVALSVAEVTTNQVLRPEGVAGALLADRITLATPRTAQQAHWEKTGQKHDDRESWEESSHWFLSNDFYTSRLLLALLLA